jgi:hypothetical protein
MRSNPTVDERLVVGISFCEHRIQASGSLCKIVVGQPVNYLMKRIFCCRRARERCIAASG